MIQAYRNGKIEVGLNEDVKTSSIIGEMLHLSSELFWKLLRGTNNALPEYGGEICSVEFWPKWNARGGDIRNKQYVEPDVFIRFEQLDLILEIKKDDGIGRQYETQWSNEICSYLNEYKDDKKDEDDKKFVFLAFGGNESLDSQEIEVRGKKYVIFKCRWWDLLRRIHEQLYILRKLPFKDGGIEQTIRILQDIESVFNMYGDYIMTWLEDIPGFNFDFKNRNLNVFNTWKI